MAQAFYVYLLLSTTGKTYVGATVDPLRRLQQHNGQRSGGARATRGGVWEHVCYLEGIPEWRSALQIEWKWKALRRGRRGSPLQRSLTALCALLALEKPTATAVPYALYPNGLPTIHWVSQEAERMY